MPRESELPRFPFAHTYSIVARDPQTGEMGVAVQSHWFSTGSLVTWATPGVGVVATQATVEVGYGPKSLEKLFDGVPPEKVLASLLAADENREVRQVAMVDFKGRVAAFTGSRCIAEAGHQIGTQYSVQANMMMKNTVWSAMARAFETTVGNLSDRLLSALDAAQGEGGDIRGMQSAALLVVSGNRSEHPWTEVIADLRVEDHPSPLHELRRLLNLQRAYAFMNSGDSLLAQGKVEDAMLAYQKGVHLAPEVKELPFWQAVTLADCGRVEESLPFFSEAFKADPNWAVLFTRLPAAGLFKNDLETISRILSVRY